MSKHETIKLIEPNAPQRSPARAALAVAIQGANEAKSAYDAVTAAIARAKVMVDDAERRVADAGEDVAKAKAAQAERAARAAISGSTISQDRSTRTARAMEIDAIDDLEAARAALVAVKATLYDPEYYHNLSQRELRKAAQAVLTESVDFAVSEVVRLKADLEAAFGRLFFLADNAFGDFPSPQKSMVEHHLSFPKMDWTPSNPMFPPWRAYLDRLMIDADAQPPSN